MADLKKVKDFTDEEKAAILARADRIEIARVAKEFNTTWQVVSAIQRSAKNAKNKKGKATKITKSAKTASGRAPQSSDERRLAILQRASEVGVNAAAAEAGVSKWTVFQWRKLMKKAGYDVPRAAKVRTKTNAAATASTTKVAAISRSKPAGSTYSNVEFENELLKQKVAALNEQVAKLRAALSALA